MAANIALTDIIILKNLVNFPLNHNFIFSRVFYDLDKFSRLKTQKENTKEKKPNMCDATLKLYHEMLQIYFDEYYDLSDAKRSKMDPKHDPIYLTLDGYDYEEWYEEESDDLTVKDGLQPLEGDEKSKRRKKIKNCSSKQTTNQAPSISTSKSWK